MRRLALVGLLLLAGCGPLQASHHLVGSRCADVVLLGLRGQGQSATSHHGVGNEVEGAVEALADRLRGHSTVRLQAVRYPADPPPTLAALDADVATGVRMVRSQARSLHSRCPRTRIGLVGFSEGARVAHLAAVRDAGPWAVVVLMGDPLREPQPGVRALSFGPTFASHGKDGVGPRFPMQVRGRVLEVCVARDNVCDAAIGGSGVSEAHRDFYERVTTSRRIGSVAARLLTG